MRRRSERKKSTDVSSSPAVARRSGRTRRKSPSISESEKNTEDCNEMVEEAENRKCASRSGSEEPHFTEKSRRSRSTRKRTPVNDIDSPSKRKTLHREDSEEKKIQPIPEEENGAVERAAIIEQGKVDVDVEDVVVGNQKDIDDDGRKKCMDTKEKTDDKNEVGGIVGTRTEVTDEKIHEEVTKKEVIGNSRSPSPKETEDEEKSKTSDVLDIKEDSQEDDDQYGSSEVSEKRSVVAKEKDNTADNNSRSILPAKILVKDSKDNGENDVKNTNDISPNKKPGELDSNENSVIQIEPILIEREKSFRINDNQTIKKTTTDDTVRTRKRKWLTKKNVENSSHVLAISTDSLKGLISDVHPVPLSDVRLESSPEVQVLSEREEGEETPSPERRDERVSIEKSLEKPANKRTPKEQVATVPAVVTATAAAAAVAVSIPNAKLQRSPSPARNQASNVLYITNLVRPFTVLQLKGLLARTGKIVEDGFWIDRIKSKCFVQYETEDEAIETRHALHGVRWPVSNPKCLNVDFGSKLDMQRAIDSTKDEAPKLGQDNKDNIIVGWNRGERIDETERKSARPVREWDVGKKETLERENAREIEKRDRERDRDRDRGHERDRDTSANRENVKNSNERKSRTRGRERSRSISPVRKMPKKENEPPLRLLDDLFRKTKAAPCIYWLPLTPEQIAEKEAFRQKRIQEHKERMKQRELEREVEREKQRERDRNRNNDRDRRNRSSGRTRSRDRRRY